MQHDLTDHVVLVTGGAGGIGSSVASVALSLGARVVVGDLDEAAVRRTVSELGAGASGYVLDVTDERSWERFVTAAHAEHGRIDGLVNNAGTATGHSLFDTSPDEMSRVLAVNTMGPFLGVRAVVPHMRDRSSGSIVNICSGGALTGLRSNIAYGTSKYALRGLTQMLVHELGGYGIRVNSVFPGHVNTTLSRPGWSADAIAAGTTPADVALGRTALPGEIAEAICFLLTDAASYCTGTELVVDGGLTSVIPRRGDEQ